MDDLAIIIVSTNEAHWLRPCLSSVLEHQGDCSLDLVVVDNASEDGTDELVAEAFPNARVVASENHGFAHANNRGLMTTDSRYVLFLNPDTEIVEGTFAGLIQRLDELPEAGLAGVVQLTSDGEVYPTIRRFPSPLRALGQAAIGERFPFRVPRLQERELDLSVYERETPCDWTSGSFMLARREALESSGYLDERFFIYSEEPDLCLRMKRDGWQIIHLPDMRIVHHAGKAGVRPKMSAQEAYARMQYAHKFFSRPQRLVYAGALALGYGVRAIRLGGPARSDRRAGARAAFRIVVGLDGPPFGEPPHQAVALRRPPRPSDTSTET
jgi:N-acetylglucosaminyl-diphospho-decaprenol L-rhamnosyltransferase